MDGSGKAAPIKGSEPSSDGRLEQCLDGMPFARLFHWCSNRRTLEAAIDPVSGAFRKAQRCDSRNSPGMKKPGKSVTYQALISYQFL